MPANDSMARLARLARLAPSEEELARFSTQCDDIINYIKREMNLAIGETR